MVKLAFYAAGAGLLLAGGVQPALAKDIPVQMRTKGKSGAYVFEPAFIQAAVGDRVRFLPTDPAHNAQVIPSMIPAGVAPTKGAIGKEYVLTVSKPGVYGVECLPHYSMGMVALVQAGAGPSANLAAAKKAKLPPLAGKRMAALLARAK